MTATVLVTLFFGIFGIIPAATASSEAARNGYPTGGYWAAFVLILILQMGLGLMLFAAAAGM